MLQLMINGYTCNNRNERLLFTSSEFYSELDIYLVSLSFSILTISNIKNMSNIEFKQFFT